MGCVSSKQSKCRHCHAPFSPINRKSLSGLSVNYHNPYDMEGDSYHVVALTSSTLGSIKLDLGRDSRRDGYEEGDGEMRKNDEVCNDKNDKNDKFMIGMIEAKAWSKMIDEKIPKVFPRTPVRTPNGEPETIDVRELMDGLEDISPVRVGEHLRSFSFHVSVDSIPALVDSPRVGEGCVENCVVLPKETIGFDSREREGDDLIPPIVDSTRVGEGCVENCVVLPKKTIGFDSREREGDDLIPPIVDSSRVGGECLENGVVSEPKKTMGFDSRENESDDLIPPIVDSSRVVGECLENGVVSEPKKTMGFDSQEKERDGLKPTLGDSSRGEEGYVENGVVSHKKTIWFDCQEDSNGLGNDNSISKGLESEFDPEVIYAFRKALVELSPIKSVHLKPRDGVCDEEEQVHEIMPLDVSEENVNVVFTKDVTEEKKLNGYVHVNGIVDRVVTEEEKENLAPSENGDVCTKGFVEEEIVDYVHGAKKRVVLYFTSLRGVRKTYEDCCYVRLTLKALRVKVDERDVSMHSGFKEELKELLGEGAKGCLPKVFIGDKYIGGTEEIRQLHEDGNVEKVVEGCEMLSGECGNLINLCEGCGDVRFVPCETCSGSCKIYYEFEEDDEEYEENEYGFQRCLDCNENGLVRCPLCCY